MLEECKIAPFGITQFCEFEFFLLLCFVLSSALPKYIIDSFEWKWLNSVLNFYLYTALF